MKIVSRWIWAALPFWSADALALPSRQYPAQGLVEAVERDRLTFALSRPGGDRLTSFAVQDARTRFRQDGEKAVAEQLPVGQAVRLFFKNKMGVWVAVEVAWKTDALPKK